MIRESGSTTHYDLALLTCTEMDLALLALAGDLKAKGKKTLIINLQTDEYGDPNRYPDEVVARVLELLKGIPFVGFSVFDMFFNRVVFLIKKTKQTYQDAKIVLGGVHAELYPEECISIDEVDAVCVGDGYQALAELIDSWNDREYIELLNMWVKLDDGAIKKTTKVHFFSNKELDQLPMPDYSFKDYWVLDAKTNKLIKDIGNYHVTQHQVGHEQSFVVSFMTGCIHRCSYCNVWAKYQRNITINAVNFPPCRKKSPARVIDELKEIKKLAPRFLVIMDNDFCIRTEEEIKEFSKAYKRDIFLPFYCMVSPDTISEKKLTALIEAGLVELNMGIQTTGKVNRLLYNRPISDNQILQVTSMINKYVKLGHIDAFYDFIIFNAAMTRQDLIEMIQLIRKIPEPFDQVSHHLTLGPEVELYKRFKKEGKIYYRDLQKMYESNFHEFDFDEYISFPNFYLNLILEWMAGRHDDKLVGRLPRNPAEFMLAPPMLEVKKRFRPVYDSLYSISAEFEDVRDFLLDERVLDKIEFEYSVLKLINNKLPVLIYSNQKR